MSISMSLVPAISAASVLAKTFRDDLMVKLGARWPEYGFAKHKACPTKDHMNKVREIGPCPEHRKSFLSFLNK